MFRKALTQNVKINCTKNVNLQKVADSESSRVFIHQSDVKPSAESESVQPFHNRKISHSPCLVEKEIYTMKFFERVTFYWGKLRTKV